MEFYPSDLGYENNTISFLLNTQPEHTSSQLLHVRVSSNLVTKKQITIRVQIEAYLEYQQRIIMRE